MPTNQPSKTNPGPNLDELYELCKVRNGGPSADAAIVAPLRVFMHGMKDTVSLGETLAAVTQVTEAQEARGAQLAEDTATLRAVHTGMMQQLDRVRADLEERAKAEQAEQQRLADQAEQKRIQDYLDTEAIRAEALRRRDAGEPPDPFTPSGDLHTIPPTTPRHEQELAALSDQGSLPRSITRKAPANTGTDPTIDPAEFDHPYPPRNVQQQPIAISLNEV
jgi:hypothetical protein